MRMRSPLQSIATVLCMAVGLASMAGAEEDLEALAARLTELYRQGNYADATAVAKRALAIRERDLGPDHPDTARSLDDLAELYRAQGQFAEAEPLFRRAVAIYEKTLGPDHETTLAAIRRLATCHALAGDFAAAEALLSRSIKAMEKTLCGRAYDATIAAASVELAECIAAQGRGAEAREAVAKAGDLLTRLNWPDSPVGARGQAIVAATLAREARDADALAAADQAARGMHAGASRGATLALAAEPGDGRPGVRDVLLSLAWRQRAEPGVAARAAEWLVNDKAAADLAARQRATLARLADDTAAAADVRQLVAARGDLAAFAGGHAGCGGDGERVARVLADEARLAATVFAGRERHAAAPAAGWTEIEAVRAAVPVGAAFVVIGRFVESDLPGVPTDRERPASRVIAAVVPPAGRGEIALVDLGPAAAIDGLVASHREAIDAVSGYRGFARGHFTLEQELRAAALPVTRAVLEPILAAAGDVDELIIAPDDVLWLLGWQSLPLGPDDDSPYAIERYSIRLVTTAGGIVERGLGDEDDPGDRLGPAVIFGDPDFDRPQADGGGRPEFNRVSRLPATLAEARAAGAAAETLFAEPPQILVGARASEAALKAVRRPRLVSIASHGCGGTTEITRGIVLAGANTGASEPDDGLLSVAEIERLDLAGTRLAVLSVGGSAVGRPVCGAGVADLRHAFLAAGCRQVVATAWELADRESAQIMAAFYANLAQGQPASKALREAQLAFIKERRADRNYEAAHPYHWAAYGVTGR